LASNVGFIATLPIHNNLVILFTITRPSYSLYF